MANVVNEDETLQAVAVAVVVIILGDTKLLAPPPKAPPARDIVNGKGKMTFFF